MPMSYGKKKKLYAVIALTIKSILLYAFSIIIVPPWEYHCIRADRGHTVYYYRLKVLVSLEF